MLFKIEFQKTLDFRRHLFNCVGFVFCTLCYDANDLDDDGDNVVDDDRNLFGRLHATPSKSDFVHRFIDFTPNKKRNRRMKLQ